MDEASMMTTAQPSAHVSGCAHRHECRGHRAAPCRRGLSQGGVRSAESLPEALDTDSTYKLAQHLHAVINQGIPADGFLDVCRTAGREQEADEEAALRDR
ncbi:hypothetical protein HW130_34675 [Streptomyces sp. PKU-EA00015]|uniref:hypothetical protein n=1 Tax=Streptomyces sp. PKU-EA00015 TaxID=2748326 RepID=UPI0015A45E42|nr:hypothetical protein [Streptomyces sp. PKU-EA00015]NWF31304.1 hypothetical protein [Streptomyces sp. PKU-EA00015]